LSVGAFQMRYLAGQLLVFHHLHVLWSLPLCHQAHCSVFPYQNVLRHYRFHYSFSQAPHLHDFLQVRWILKGNR
jgi:hypothetical protein